MADFMGGNSGQRGELIKVMGLWEEKDRNGNNMFSGSLGGRARIQIVLNDRKQSDREPDYFLTVVQSERQANPDDPNAAPQQETPRYPVRIMGLWQNTDRKGKTYLNGSVQSLRVLIFANNFKQGDREPDYILYVAQADRQQGQQGGGFGGGQQGGGQGFGRGGQQPFGYGQQGGGQGFGQQPANPGAISNTGDDDVPF